MNRTNDEGVPRTTRESPLQLLIIYGLFIAAMITMLALAGTDNASHRWEWPLNIYGSLMMVYLVTKMLLAFRYRPVEGPVPALKVSAVVPNYNEAPDALADTIHSLMQQTHPLHEVFVIDDGSRDESGYQAAKALEARYPTLTVHRMDRNVGKRRAQGWAFRRLTGDLILTVDSDTTYDPEAVAELVKPFADPRVMGVGGQIRARNRNQNFMTRLLDMRYQNAYRVERAAQSVTNSVLCCSGPIGIYRAHIVLDNLEDYENQLFLGEVVTAGDDRRLTQYALKAGVVRYQGTATCATTIPDNVPVFIKQQIRWAKSFFRESGESLKFAWSLRRWPVLMWTSLEILLWFTYTVTLSLALLLHATSFGKLFLVYYFAYVALAAYARNVYYVLKHPHIFLLAPVYGLFHLVILFPIRLYALATLKNTGWGTR